MNLKIKAGLYTSLVLSIFIANFILMLCGYNEVVALFMTFIVFYLITYVTYTIIYNHLKYNRASKNK